MHDTHRKSTTQFEQVRDTQVPDSMRALAERNVAQTRELYERSKNAFQAVLESWENFLGGAVALNRKIIDMTERNIASSFDLATSLAGAPRPWNCRQPIGVNSSAICLKMTYRKGDAPWLVCTELKADDPEAIFTRDEFKALAWTTAKAKAREMGWIR